MLTIVEKKKIVAERASDVAYAKIIDILCKHLTRPGVWQASVNQLKMPNGTYAEQVYAKIKYERDGGVVLDIWKDLEKNLSKEEKTTLNDIFPEIQYLSKVLFELYLYIRPKEYDPKIGGYMARNGEMAILPRYWQKAVEENDPNAKKTIDLLNSGKFFDQHILSTFRHEFGHHLNAIRSSPDLNDSSKRIDYRNKGGPNQFDTTKKEYAESTEELQARLADVFTIVQSAINKKSIDELESHEKYILGMLATNDIKNFIKFFETPYMYAYNKKLVDKRFIFRVKKRLYSGFIDFSKQESAIKDYAKKNPKLFYTKYNFRKFTDWVNELNQKIDNKIDSLLKKFTSFFS